MLTTRPPSGRDGPRAGPGCRPGPEARSRVLCRPPRSLQQPRQPPVLQHPPARLLLGAVGHHVVLEVNGLEGGAAPGTRLALLAMDLERHRRLVGQRLADDLLVVDERVAE